MKPTPALVLRSALLLGGCALLAVLLLDGLHRVTRERIQVQEQRAQRDALGIVLPSDLYDNDPTTDLIRVRAPAWLGHADSVRVWRARRDGVATAVVLEAVAPDGYAGPIALLIGVRTDGRLSGVRVTAHKETPGLGDKIEAGRSDWITRFDGLGRDDPSAERWTVRRDGGEFDQFAGATVTPRAIVAAVKRALDYIHLHGTELQNAPSGAELEHLDAP